MDLCKYVIAKGCKSLQVIHGKLRIYVVCNFFFFVKSINVLFIAIFLLMRTFIQLFGVASMNMYKY